MKKLIFILLILAFGISGKTQTLNQVWSKDFTWNGNNDQTTKIIYNPSGLFVNGWKDGNAGDLHSALAKFNLQTGDSTWKEVDTTTNTLSDLQFCVVNNKIFYLSSNSSLFNYLVIRDMNTGQLVGVKKLEARTSFCEYGDSIIGVTSQGRVKIFNSIGDSVRSFPLGYNLSNGYVSLKYLENKLFVCGLYNSGGYNSFLEKRNIMSGELLWRRNFLGATSCRNNIDWFGNAYTTLHFSNNDSLIKFDTAGNRVFQIVLSPSQPVGIFDLAIDKKNQVIVLAGSTTNQTSGKTVGWVSGRKIINGDSVFAFELVWNSNHNSNGVKGIACDTSGNFYLVGQSYTTNIVCHVRKYHYDTLTGITVVGSENPVGFKLSQNYPNPFNPVTKIVFAIPKKSTVTLKVYDILGKEVQTLVNETKTAGNYSVDFNGKNLPSGTYFYRMEVDGFSDGFSKFSEVKKMSLIK